MIPRYLCLPVLLTAVFCMGAPARAQQGSPPQHAQNQRALGTPDSASRSVQAGGTPSVQEVEVRRVRISKTDSCQVIMDLGGRVQYQAARLSDPDRIYFDIEHARLSDELLRQPVDVPSGRCLKAVRVAQKSADVVRVVLDVAQVKDYSVSELADPDRLVVDLYGAANSPGAAANSATETSAKTVEVSRLRVSNANNCAQVIMDLGGRVQYQAARLSDPDRIYFDIEHARLSNELLRQPVDVPSGRCLKAVRVAQKSADVVRVVLDVAQVKDYSVSELADPDRLVVDLYGAANSPGAAANSATETSAKTVEVSRLRVSNANNCAQVIMDLGGRVQYQAARLSDPDRIYFDIEHARLSNELLRQPVDVPSGRCLKAVRVVQKSADVVRVVLDVAQVKDYSVSELAVPDRLVADAPASADTTAANAAPETNAKTPTTAPPETSPRPATGQASAPRTAPSETAPGPATG